MKKHKRPTKLEEARLKVHLDVDHNKEEALSAALQVIRQTASLIIGQEGIENHDVTIVIGIEMQERNRPKPKITDFTGRDVGVGQRI